MNDPSHAEVAEGVTATGVKAEAMVISLPKGGVLAGWFPVEKLNEFQF